MASEVTSDLNSELSGLNNLCSSAFLAPKCFFEPFQRKEEGRKEGQNGHVDLRARTSPQVKSILESSGFMNVQLAPVTLLSFPGGSLVTLPVRGLSIWGRVQKVNRMGSFLLF